MYFVTDFIIDTPTFLLLDYTWFYRPFSPARMLLSILLFPESIGAFSTHERAY
jgi:hypothetical protein